MTDSAIVDGLARASTVVGKQRTPIGRVGRPEEVADLAHAILRNGYVTSQVFSIDAGIHPR